MKSQSHKQVFIPKLIDRIVWSTLLVENAYNFKDIIIKMNSPSISLIDFLQVSTEGMKINPEKNQIISILSTLDICFSLIVRLLHFNV